MNIDSILVWCTYYLDIQWYALLKGVYYFDEAI